MELKQCPDCTHSISVTAISCPVCGWVTPLEEDSSSDGSAAKKARKAGVWLGGAAIIAALGPAAVAGAIGSLLAPSGVDMKGVRKKAKELGAIDSFRLSDNDIALVTEHSIWTVDGRGGNREIPLKELTHVEVDGSKIRRKTTFGIASATITLMFRCRKLFGGFYDAPNDYVSTGEHSLATVKFAREKLNEYLRNGK